MTEIPHVSPPPAAPQRSEPATFSNRADALVRWLAPFVSQVNAAVHFIAANVANAAEALAHKQGAEAAKTAALASQTAAAGSATNAAAAEQSARQVEATVLAAANAQGQVAISATKAEADAATWANGDVVEVQADETLGGHRTRYRFTGGALTLLLDMDASGENELALIIANQARITRQQFHLREAHFAAHGSYPGA